MIVADMVKICAEMLKMLSKNGVRTEDYQYVDMYYDFLSMRSHRLKYRCTVDELAAKYGISKSTVERVIKRFRGNLKT